VSASFLVQEQEVAPVTTYDVTVECGRDDIESQPDASILNATLNRFLEVEIGDPVTLADEDGILFHGWLTDQTAELDPSDMSWAVKVIATGPLAVLGHARAGGVDYPQESDSARIVRVLDEAGALYLVDPGILGPQLLPRTAEAESAAELARKAADDGMGVLWEQPADPADPIRYTPQRLRHWAPYKLAWAELDPALAWDGFGALTWADLDSDHLGGPPGTPPALELDPATTLAEATFEQRIGDWARTITVTWGTAAEGSTDRPVVAVGAGEPVQDHTTDLALVDEATAYANTMLRRSQQPAWRLQGIRIPLHRIDAAGVRAALTVGTRLTVPFPLGSPVGYLWQGFLEGWKHHLIGQDDVEEHWLELRTSERSLTEASDRWQDIAPGITWDGTDPAMRWIDALNWRAS
jgi:hypothetical protein